MHHGIYEMGLLAISSLSIAPVKPPYNLVIFLKVQAKDTPQLAREDVIWGIFCKSITWSISAFIIVKTYWGLSARLQ